MGNIKSMDMGKFLESLKQSNIENRVYLSVILLFFLAYFLFFWPFYYDQPTNDDWSYARTVEYMINDGELKIIYWVPHSILAQSFIGAFFALIFGMNFSALKISTFFVSLF